MSSAKEYATNIGGRAEHGHPLKEKTGKGKAASPALLLKGFSGQRKAGWSGTGDTHSSVNYSSVGNQPPTRCYQSNKPDRNWTNQSHLEKTFWQSSPATSDYSGENVLCVGVGWR